MLRKDGKRYLASGLKVQYFENGKIFKFQNYYLGLLTGPSWIYNVDGTIKQYRLYDPEGSLIYSADYKDNKIVGFDGDGCFFTSNVNDTIHKGNGFFEHECYADEIGVYLAKVEMKIVSNDFKLKNDYTCTCEFEVLK